MNLRKKTILLVAAIVLVTLVATVVASNVVVLSGFSKIEHNEVVTQLERARDALDSQVTSLDLFVVDYATWDDTYQFILDNNTAYIQANLVDQTFQHSDLNLIMYVNNSGDIVYSKTYNIINQDFIQSNLDESRQRTNTRRSHNGKTSYTRNHFKSARPNPSKHCNKANIICKQFNRSFGCKAKSDYQ